MWKPEHFQTASAGGAYVRYGYVYRGLGLYRMFQGSPKGRRPPTWCLVHLGSGHAVVNIVGHVADAFPVAGEIAECGDWTFDSLDGWKNRDLELPVKVRAIIARHPKKRFQRTGELGQQNEAVAAEIARARA